MKPADLVRRSGRKPNGRPVIDASRVTAWTKGERPSHRLTVLAARSLGVPARDALRAAGYDAGEEDVTEPNHQPAPEIDPRPVGLGLDSEADGLTPEQIESVRAVIRAMKPPPETA